MEPEQTTPEDRERQRQILDATIESILPRDNTIREIRLVSREMYREIQLDFTPQIEVFYMLFERCHTKNRKRSLKLVIKYFNFRNRIQLKLLNHPVQGCPKRLVLGCVNPMSGCSSAILAHQVAVVRLIELYRVER